MHVLQRSFYSLWFTERWSYTFHWRELCLLSGKDKPFEQSQLSVIIYSVHAMHHKLIFAEYRLLSLVTIIFVFQQSKKIRRNFISDAILNNKNIYLDFAFKIPPNRLVILRRELTMQKFLNLNLFNALHLQYLLKMPYIYECKSAFGKIYSFFVNNQNSFFIPC